MKSHDIWASAAQMLATPPLNMFKHNGSAIVNLINIQLSTIRLPGHIQYVYQSNKEQYN